MSVDGTVGPGGMNKAADRIDLSRCCFRSKLGEAGAAWGGRGSGRWCDPSMGVRCHRFAPSRPCIRRSKVRGGRTGRGVGPSLDVFG